MQQVCSTDKLVYVLHMGFANESLLMLFQDFSVHFQNIPRVGWTLDRRCLGERVVFLYGIASGFGQDRSEETAHIWCISEH